MDNNAINKWLDDLARYFETRDRHGEDRAHWADVYNAENARKIKAALAASEAEIDRLKTASADQLVEANKMIARLIDQLYVPGVMRCAKCKFRLHRITLYMGDGSVGAGDNKTEPCPNGCGPLWSCTWKDEATENLSICETQVAEVARLKEALDVRELFINPHLLEKYADEVDCCPGCDRESTDFDTGCSMCRASERGDYCPNNLAETLRAVAKVARQALTGETDDAR